MSRTRAQAKRHAALIMASCVVLLVTGYLVGEARGVALVGMSLLTGTRVALWGGWPDVGGDA